MAVPHPTPTIIISLSISSWRRRLCSNETHQFHFELLLSLEPSSLHNVLFLFVSTLLVIAVFYSFLYYPPSVYHYHSSWLGAYDPSFCRWSNSCYGRWCMLEPCGWLYVSISDQLGSRSFVLTCAKIVLFSYGAFRLPVVTVEAYSKNGDNQLTTKQRDVQKWACGDAQCLAFAILSQGR